MAAAEAANKTSQAAAAAATSDNAIPPAKLVDPQLLMAARCGDSKRIKELLRLNTEEVESHGNSGSNGDVVVESAASAGAVILEVAPDSPPAAPTPPPLVDGVTLDGDTLLHVVAACGDGEDFIDCAKLIVHDKKRTGGAEAVRLAQEARNRDGDTPLHCAARAGNVNMVSYLLVDLIPSTTDDEAAVAAAKKAFLRTQNESGETALHQAVRAANDNKEVCIDKLMAVDPELACIPHEDGASPLYLAISLGEIEIARHLYAKSKGELSYCGPDGTNVLHAAVSQGQEEALCMVLEWLTTAADDMRQPEGQGHADLHLLSHLTSQRDKENGSTPLHLAASLPGLPSPGFMYKTHHHFWGWSGSPARLLLAANRSMAYQPDKGGLYPIHVAAGAGSLRVVMALLWTCPDCATLRDTKGRTFLHVAVEECRHRVVKYVCRLSRVRRHKSSADAAVARLLPSILNAQDINGDTALHHAVRTRWLRLFSSLARNHRVRLHVKNKEGMTPIDVAWSEMPLKVYYAWDSRIQIRNYLVQVGAPYGESRGDLFHQKHVLSKQDEDKLSENLTATAQVLGLFSVLMTTATFASAFTLPGGYISAGDAAAGGRVAGTPVLTGPRSYAFDAFVLSNALAFLCSLFATSLLLYAGVPSETLTHRFATINVAYSFMWQAGRCLLAAFALGLYVVLFPVARTIAIAVLVFVIIAVVGFIKDSEGIHSMTVFGRRGRLLSRRGFLIHWIIYALDHFWTNIIIFGLPAIRKWAKLP